MEWTCSYYFVCIDVQCGGDEKSRSVELVLGKKQITSDVQYMFVLNPSSRPLSMNEPTFWAIASGIFWIKLNKTK
jgi:hypothetical protein